MRKSLGIAPTLRPAVLFVVLAAGLTSRATTADAASGFQWVDRPEQGTADLLYNGQPALCYMYAFDRSSPRRTEETYRVFHQVFGPGTGDQITKGAGGYEPHHRGLFVGWRDTEVEGKTINTWSRSNGAYQRHVRFLEQKADPKRGSMTSEITWNDANDKPFLGEIRSVRVENVGPSDGPPVWQIDWTSTLTSRRGEIKLRGDRQHAGFQFRAAQEVADKKSATYIRPKGFPQEPQPFEVDDRKNPDRHVNLGWFAMSYEVKGTRYTVAYFEDPALPKPSMYSERPYGRFGAYFKATVTPDKPLTMRYRLIVTSGTAPDRDAIQAQYDRFVADLARSPDRSEPK